MKLSSNLSCFRVLTLTSEILSEHLLDYGQLFKGNEVANKRHIYEQKQQSHTDIRELIKNTNNICREPKRKKTSCRNMFQVSPGISSTVIHTARCYTCNSCKQPFNIVVEFQRPEVNFLFICSLKCCGCTDVIKVCSEDSL